MDDTQSSWSRPEIYFPKHHVWYLLDMFYVAVVKSSCDQNWGGQIQSIEDPATVDGRNPANQLRLVVFSHHRVLNIPGSDLRICAPSINMFAGRGV